MAPLRIYPPLLNSSNPWCTTLEQLQERKLPSIHLYDSPHTGAVTTRTSLLTGFPHDPSHHQFTFFDPSSYSTSPPSLYRGATSSQTGSLNTLGYSPLALSQYISFIRAISSTLPASAPLKPIIISVTGSELDVATCYAQILACQFDVRIPLAMEVNLSCPNIPGKPPPAYEAAALIRYLAALTPDASVPIGIKMPPYTYADQFTALRTALLHISPCPISFITAVNTLGSSLLPGAIASANGSGVGGLAGSPLHALALGNVYTIAQMLGGHAALAEVQIIGVGGVEDRAGYERMRGVGAGAVGVGTGLGRRGVGVFGEILESEEEDEGEV